MSKRGESTIHMQSISSQVKAESSIDPESSPGWISSFLPEEDLCIGTDRIGVVAFHVRSYMIRARARFASSLACESMLLDGNARQRCRFDPPRSRPANSLRSWLQQAKF